MNCCANLCRTLLRRKNLSEGRSMQTVLQRCLRVHQIVSFGLSRSIGAGIYILIGYLIKEIAGPALCFTFLLGFITIVFTATCYAELASYLPRAGACYTYTYIFIGELPALTIGWTVVGDFIVQLSLKAKVFAGSVNILTNGTLTSLSLQYFGKLPDYSFFNEHIDVVAPIMILLCLFVPLTGANLSMTFTAIMMLLHVIFLTFIIVILFIHGDIMNWDLQNSGFVPFGVKGIFAALPQVALIYNGFEDVSSTAEECVNPKRDIPLAFLIVLIIIAVLHISMTLGLSFMVPRTVIELASPLVAAFRSNDLMVMSYVTAGVTFVAIILGIIASIYTGGRLIYAMSSDGIIFKPLAYIHSGTKVPIFAMMVGASLSCCLSLFFDIQILAEFNSFGIVLSFTTVGINTILFRYFYRDNDKVDDIKMLRNFGETLANKFPALRQLSTLKIAFVSYLISCVIFAVITNYFLFLDDWFIWLMMGLSVLMILLSFFTMCLYEPQHYPDSFQTPLQPLTPCLTIFCNLIVLFQTKPSTWIRAAVWFAVALLIYFTYGVRNSKANEYGSVCDDYIELKNEGEIEELEQEKNQADYGALASDDSKK